MYYNDNTIVYHDGKWICARDANASLYAQTLHYGTGVFEGIRTYSVNNRAKMFRGDEHYKRLLHSAHSIGLPLDMRSEELIQITYELLEKNNLIEAYIRPFVYSSPMMSLSYPEEAHIAICVWPWKKLLGDKTISLSVSPYCRPHPGSCKINAKVSGHYVNSILAATEARGKGYDDALQLDVEGNVAECSGANFFMEKDGILYTPVAGHILPGITRDTILQMCRQMGIMVKQKKITVEEVYDADGAFCVGTAAEVTGINSLNNRNFRKEWHETLGHGLQKEYESHTRKENVWEGMKF